MALDIHFGDKLIPGLENSVGIRTKDKPTVRVRQFGGSELKSVLTRMDTEIWKVRFKLPLDAKGEVEVDARAGSDSKTEKKAIG
ncbi:MAG TPA: hypothetical protein VFF73_27275 [Planctomycetota bacterium]|nr:hypothetical protein [Planctomycetota bacterium]